MLQNPIPRRKSHKIKIEKSNIKKHLVKKWEVSIMEFKNHLGKKFKVTRHLPELSVAETKLFKSKRKAKKQFDEWLK